MIPKSRAEKGLHLPEKYSILVVSDEDRICQRVLESLEKPFFGEWCYMDEAEYVVDGEDEEYDMAIIDKNCGMGIIVAEELRILDRNMPIVVASRAPHFDYRIFRKWAKRLEFIFEDIEDVTCSGVNQLLGWYLGMNMHDYCFARGDREEKK